jgi:hypothetical protein
MYSFCYVFSTSQNSSFSFTSNVLSEPPSAATLLVVLSSDGFDTLKFKSLAISVNYASLSTLDLQAKADARGGLSP